MGLSTETLCNLMCRWMKVWTFRRKECLHLQGPNRLETLYCLLLKPLRKADSRSPSDPSKISQKVRIFVSDAIRHQLHIPSVQTADAAFGQNIVSRGGAETGDILSKIESVVQCNVETDDYIGQQTDVKTRAKMSF